MKDKHVSKNGPSDPGISCFREGVSIIEMTVKFYDLTWFMSHEWYRMICYRIIFDCKCHLSRLFYRHFWLLNCTSSKSVWIQSPSFNRWNLNKPKRLAWQSEECPQRMGQFIAHYRTLFTIGHYLLLGAIYYWAIFTGQWSRRRIHPTQLNRLPGDLSPT